MLSEKLLCRPPAAFSRLHRVKRPLAFSFKLDLVLKTLAASFSEINPVKDYIFKDYHFFCRGNLS